MATKRALVIGVDKYSNLDQQYQLAGCVNDAKLIKRVLLDHFNFDESNVTELHNEAASRDRIVAEMNRLVAEANDDDVVVFHFSGHGSQRTAADPDEGTGLDSTIMPHDSGRDPLKNLDISDDEINEWLGRLAQKTRYITLTFDCCHSGTITRDAFGAKARSVEADTRSLAAMGIDAARSPTKIRKAQARKAGPSGWLALSDAYVVMSGCRDDELSYEFAREDGGDTIRGGALTYYLTNALTRAKPGSTYRDVFELARLGVNTQFSNQHPQIEGAQDREIFGVRDIEALRYVSVAAVDGKKVTLNGGAAHGLCSRSLWAVYPQGTKHTKGTKALGRIEVERVGPLTAEATIRKANGAIEVGARCVEKVPATAQYRLQVDLSALPKEARATLEPGIEKSALLTVASTAEAADVRAYVLEPRNRAGTDHPVPQVVKVESRTWAIVDREGALAMPLHAVDEKSVVATLVSNLEATARYRNALRLDNPDSDLDVAFNIYRQLPDGELQAANGGDFVFDDGDCLVIEIVNREDKPVFVSVLDFGLTGNIKLFYPPNKASEMIGAGQTLRIGTGERKIRLGLPANFAADQGTETVKAFITSNEADFRWLQQQGMRSTDTARSRLREQFEAAYNGPTMRDAAYEGGADEDKEAWTAIGRSFVLRRR